MSLEVPSPPLRQQFVAAMSHVACSVTVVTTEGVAGRFGLTVSAMSSVSADGEHPTLLVCLDHRSAATDALLANGVFCVNVLRENQAHISDTFAGRTGASSADRFAVARWLPMASGVPRVVDPLVAFSCRVLSAQQVGTHFIILGAVLEVFEASARGTPLVYANRAYGTVQRFEPSAAPPAGASDPPH